MEDYEVFWPLGRRLIEDIDASDRPPELRGRTIAFLWDELFRGDEMWDIICGTASERFGEVNFVGWEEFGNYHASTAEERRVLGKMPEVLRARKVDLVVAAVGA